MNQEQLFEPIPADKFDLLSREDLITFAKLEQRYRVHFQRENERLRALKDATDQKLMLIEDQYITIKSKFFGKSSEKAPTIEAAHTAAEDEEKTVGPARTPKTRVLLPSQRYPDAPLIEQEIELQQLPNCKCCGTLMSDSGMTEDAEFLTVIPAKYLVTRQKRHKYRCGGCHGDVHTAPSPPRIKPGSAYSDEMMVDVALTKYCDLIPIERYAAIAGRGGIKNLPPQSLIESTHYLADFLKVSYEKVKAEILSDIVLHADETPHRMLEGDKKSNWFLWVFSSQKASYFEIHGTRSGDVASGLLKNSKCEYLVSDVFSGYAKAVRETNEYREAENRPRVTSIYCNAHARRRFKEAAERFPEEAQFFIDRYQKIYLLESSAKAKPPDEVLGYRGQMAGYFAEMKSQAMALNASHSSKSAIIRATSYFLDNYRAFTRFLTDARLPIDNNQQERLLRNPVIGRKTWYGTHSKRGAETAAVLFSLVESCKLNRVNPRKYFKCLVAALLQGQPAFTPHEFSNLSH